MSEIKKYPLLIGGKEVYTKNTATIYNKYTGEAYAEISLAGEPEVLAAVQAAKTAFENTYFDVNQRYTILMKTAELLAARKAELAEVLIAETGKTVQDANNEVDWTLGIFTEAAEEAKRLTGETVCFPVPWLDTQTCYTRREPVGIVAAITPFNFPLNLVAHKLAPALAAGNPVLLKPAGATSVIGYKLCEIMLEAGVPEGFLSYLSGSGAQIGGLLAQNPDIAFYSFTGSVEVGKQLHREIGLRKCAMELGSNSATIVCEDFDIEAAATACVDAAFGNAGQVCIHLQRLFVQRSVYDAFLKRFTQLAEALVAGNPADEATNIGPMIAESEAARVMDWIAEAQAGGAKVLCGNKREKALVWPTVLCGTKAEMKVRKDEIFGPVVCVEPFDTLPEAYGLVNDSRYGLNGAIMTKNLSTAMEAIAKIHTGSVIVGGTCGFRFGNMPYGGVKDSGLGKEGPKYAIEEMTEMKTVVILA